MTPELHLTLLILLAPVVGLAILAIPESRRSLREPLAIAGALGNLVLAAMTFGHATMLELPWLGTGFELSLRVYHTASFISTAAAGFGLLVTLFSVPFMRERNGHRQHYLYMMLSLGLVNGAVFADSLMVLLFFWEGLLGTTYGMIAIGHPNAYKTATKAFIISGITDLCLMLGVALVWMHAKTVTMSSLHLPLEGVTAAAFILLMIGAISKGGSMPFHSWIPDAAVDAPAPFMAFLPASIEKLLGIYFLSRISLDLFILTPESWVSTFMMVVGCITLIFAVMMALVQKDYKRLLSFHAISQVGYMILGIGTAVPVGIVGGLFHMINHAMYKSCLFLTGGSVEHQAGTTDLKALGGLGRAMPITMTCFLIAAASISGVPPFNGFFSKELVYDGALERGSIYYLVAVAGSFFTAASFLKLGHAAFFGKRPEGMKPVKEANGFMLVPMLTIATLCVVFGVWNQLPIDNYIVPMLPESMLEHAHGHHFSGWPTNMMLVGMTVAVLAGAVINHWFGTTLGGGAIHASDHIHHSPGLEWIYDRAERRWFDPYELFLKVVHGFSWVAYRVDRTNDWLLGASGRSTLVLSRAIRAAHTGNTSSYVLWSLVAATLVILYLGQ
ncbi:MAG TPA: complex I subunit 5 family protein [Polyangiaceae bacterium]|nr:complex I subunit 5 family protein [Polyangiaceae bacterium]